MAIFTFDQAIKKAGVKPNEVTSLGVLPISPERIEKQTISEKIAGALGFGKAVDVIGSNIARATATEEERQFIKKPTILENIGAGIQVGSTLLPAGAGANLLKNIALGVGTGYLYDVGEGLVAGEGKEALIPGIGTAIGGLVPPVLKVAGKVIGAGRGLEKKAVTKTAEVISEAIPERIPEAVSGVIQTTKEVAERIPRFVGRVQEGLQESAERGMRIRESAPVVQTAIKSNLDERIINTVQQADEPTIKAYKEIVDISENSSKTLKPKQRPEIVAGKAAGEQYGLIEKQRKTIGAKIGEAVNKLSKTVIVQMQKPFAMLDNILMENGITPIKGKLNFLGKFTPAERTRIQQLYTLARESGGSMTPRQVYDMDQLFSKLQRETRMEGLGDILVDVGEGEKSSLFRVFRDIFTNTLDEVSPEDIRKLNKAYRNIVTLQDDIESTIIKQGKYETTKGIDAAEFAQTNLRRLDSDALSAADYRAIVEEMDVVARKLGYKGARADDLITFATEMRRLYPDTIPSTGFAGGIRTGLMDLAGKALEIGKPNRADQQKALKELLESLLKK